LFAIVVWVPVYLWIYIWNYAIAGNVLFRRLPFPAMAMMLVAPILIAVAYLAGVHEAYEQFLRRADVYFVKEKDSGRERHVILLRNLEKGILFRDPITLHTEFVRWEQVTKVYRLGGGPAMASIFCRATGLLCGPLPPTP
jgi:hypothetical protein